VGEGEGPYWAREARWLRDPEDWRGGVKNGEGLIGGAGGLPLARELAVTTQLTEVQLTKVSGTHHPLDAGER